MTKKELDRLFCESPYASSPSVARVARIGEAEARTWAHELEIPKVGPSHVWDRPAVEELLDRLDEEDNEDAAEDDDGPDEADDGNDEDEDEDEDQDQDEDEDQDEGDE